MSDQERMIAEALDKATFYYPGDKEGVRAEFKRLRAAIQHGAEAEAELRIENAEEIGQLRDDITRLSGELRTVKTERDRAERETAHLRAERDHWAAQAGPDSCAALARENEVLRARLDRMTCTCDPLSQDDACPRHSS